MGSFNVTPNDTRGKALEPTKNPTPSPAAGARFVFLVCQHGAEALLKRHFLGPESRFRLAFSRPGLLTFKTETPSPPKGSDLRFPTLPKHLLIRQAGIGLGQVRGSQAGQLAEQALELVGQDYEAVHVFQRDSHLPGDRSFEPGESEISEIITQKFQEMLPRAGTLEPEILPPGAKVLDVILVEPNQWLLGFHHVEGVETRWPGGVAAVEVPENMISRAYLKMAEGLAWSELPIQEGEWCVEIGSAPGGASQRLLECGLKVCGVDPAEMDPEILGHPEFEHWRSKSSAVKRKRYSKFKWLAADANVAPNYTLDAVEDIVTYPSSQFEGLLLTVKLTSFELAEQIDSYLARVQSWGFKRVKARQLAYNRRECCIAALR